MSPVEGATMLRGVLTVYLLLVTAAGPCFCCIAGQLLARPRSSTSPAEPGPLQSRCVSANNSCGTCGSCCSTGRDSSAPARRPAPAAPCPACPCGEPSLCCGTLAGRLDDSFAPSLLRWLVDAAAGPLWFDGADRPALAVVVGPEQTFGAVPFLTASDLLHVHHRLRC
jgi:hypothetical protein